MTHLPPRADDVLAAPTDPNDAAETAIDVDTSVDDDSGDILADLRDPARVANYIDIAEREIPAADLAQDVRWMREWMRENGVGDPMVAASRRIVSGMTVVERAALVRAAVQIREEGRDELAKAPTIDSIGGDVRPDAAKKGRRKGGGKKKGPQGKRAVRWLGQLGRTVSQLRLHFGPANERLLQAFTEGWFTWDPEKIRRDPVYGWCDLSRPMDTEPPGAVPTIGGDPEYVVWGLRCDSKAPGCPSKRFQFEADSEAMREALDKGYTAPVPARVKELFEAKRSAWYATAIPTTTVIPVSLHRPSFVITVHTGDAKAVNAATALLAKTFGEVIRVESAVKRAPTKGLAPISLRHPDLLADGEVNLASDFLVWLLCRQPEALTTDVTGDIESQRARRTVKLDDLTAVEWWPEDGVELVRGAKGDEKRITVKVGGAPEEGAVLSAALASGAVPRRAVLTIQHTDRRWRVTIDAGEGNAWRLPVECKIGKGSPEELDACVDERLRLLAEGQRFLTAMMEAFLTARPGFGQLGQQYRRAIRADLDRQLSLFTGLVPRGGQVTLGDVVVSTEKPKRGKRASA